MASIFSVRRGRPDFIRSCVGLALGSILLSPCFSRADTPSPSASASREMTYVNDRVRLYRENSLADWLNQETARLDRQREQGIANTSLIAEMKAASPLLESRLLALLEQAVQSAETAVRNSGLSSPQLTPPPTDSPPLLPEDVAEIDRERQRWSQVRAEVLRNRELLSDAVARRKADFATARSTRGSVIRWTVPTLSFLFFWVSVAYARLPWLRRHRARHRGWLPLAVLTAGFALSLTVLGALDYHVFRKPDGPPMPALPPPHDGRPADDQEFATELLRAERRATNAQMAYDQSWMDWRDTVVQELPTASGLLDAWRQMRMAIRDASVSAATQAKIQEQITADLAESAAIAATLPAIAPTHQWSLGFLLLIGAHWTAFLTGVAIRFHAKCRPRRWARCPRCSTKGKLSLEVNNRVTEYVCTAPWFGGKPCNFRILPQHLAVRELYFPTLGSPGAGKTLWLMGLYTALVRMCNFDTKHLDFEEFPTEATRLIEDLLGRIEMSPQDLRKSIQSDTMLNEEDRRILLDTIHDGGLEAVGATTRAPHPLVIRFIRKNVSATNVFLHIFDYAGEITKQKRTHPLKQRMLNANGLLLFLDPSRPASELDRQMEAIAQINQDAGRNAANMPVAVCVTKLDKIEKKHDGDVESKFKQQYNQLEADADPNSMVWEHLESRSEATFEYLNSRWGKKLTSHLDRLGAHYMFFPLSAAGHARPKGPGPLRPENVLQPLLWLLTMSGYPALKRQPPSTRQN